jgi:hypothetical protein
MYYQTMLKLLKIETVVGRPRFMLQSTTWLFRQYFQVLKNYYDDSASLVCDTVFMDISDTESF